MKEFFMNYDVFLILVIVIVTMIGFLLMAFEYLKSKNLNEIRADVYQLFLKAEHALTESGQGSQRMKWVIQKARSLLPSYIRIFIPERILTAIIQYWFDGIKDLLDDGKINKSVTSEDKEG